MKAKTLFVLFIFMLATVTSLVAQTPVEFNQTTRLAALAKVWGFLKYYHPGPAKGLVAWDKVLVDAVEPVKAAHSKETFNNIIGEIIRQAGDVNFLNYLNVMPADIPEEPDFQWIEDHTVFSWYITLKLKAVKQYHKEMSNDYVTYDPYVGNARFDNEKLYAGVSYPNEQYRLLSLFRYWNIIQYFFPYKYLIGSDWEDVLNELIPVFINAASATEYHFAVLLMAARINDGHAFVISSVLNDYWGYYYPPFITSTIEGQTVVIVVFGNLLEEPELVKTGDIILTSDSIPVETIKQQLYKYMNASNESAKQRQLNRYIFRGTTDDLKLTLLRDGQENSVEVTRYTADVLNEEINSIDKGEIWKIMDGNIGYVDMGRLDRLDVERAMSELRDTRGIIFDIRNYPRSTMYAVSYYLNPQACEFAKISVPDQANPGKFYYSEVLSTGSQVYKNDYYKGKVVLLVNETTQSHAEFTCMALQTAPDVTIIGSQTSGADGNVSFFSLPGAIFTYFSGIGVYYPDGRETQRIGIVPDIVATPTIQGIIEGRDEVLEKALEFINTN